MGRKIDETDYSYIHRVLERVESGISKVKYEGIIGADSSVANTTFYHMRVRPSSWEAVWHVKYHLRAYVGNTTLENAKKCAGEYDVEYWGTGNQILSYRTWENPVSMGYKVISGHSNRLLKDVAAYNAGYVHYLGERMGSAYRETDDAWKRVFVVTLLEVDNCEVSHRSSASIERQIPEMTAELYMAQNIYSVQRAGGTDNNDGYIDITDNRAITLHLLGATLMSGHARIFTHSGCYIGTDGDIFSNHKKVLTRISKKDVTDALEEPGDTILTVKAEDHPESNYTKYAFTSEGLFARTVTLNNDNGYLPVAMPDINTVEQVQPYRFMGKRVFVRAFEIAGLIDKMHFDDGARFRGRINIISELGFSSPICIIGTRGYIVDEHGSIPIPITRGSITGPEFDFFVYGNGQYTDTLNLVKQYTTPVGGYLMLEYTKQYDGGDYYGSGGSVEPVSSYPIIKDEDWINSISFKSPYTFDELSHKGFEVLSVQGNWVRFTYVSNGVFRGDMSVEGVDEVTVTFVENGGIKWLDLVYDNDHWFQNGHGLQSPFPIRLVQ